MAHVIKIALDDLQAASTYRTHGPIEIKLLEIAAGQKTRDSSPLFVRVDFPKDGGLELRCKRGWIARLLWKLRNDAPIWEK